eukprot:952993-Pelagomonas_calceolata.AAC.1
MLMRIWRDTGSIRLQNQAVGSTCLLNSTPSGNMLVGIHNRMGMEFASNFNGTVMLNHRSCTFTVPEAGCAAMNGLMARVANFHATKDRFTRAVGWSCDCTNIALLHVAAKLLLVLLNGAGLDAAHRE